MDIKCEQWYHNTQGIQAHKRGLVVFISISKHLDDIQHSADTQIPVLKRMNEKQPFCFVAA